MSQVNSYRKINFETAIKNVGLFADNVWTTNNYEKEFIQKNQNLWIRFNEAEELCRDTSYTNKYVSNVETVKERIPNSRLASYGNFIYDKSEELFYSTYNYNETPETFKRTGYIKHSECWMDVEVEKEFRRLTSPIPTRSSTQRQNNNTEKSTKQEDSEEQKRVTAIIKHPPLRYSLDTHSEYELHMKLNAAHVKELWDIFCPYIGSSIEDLMINSDECQEVSPMIAVNCEAPEFYPKNVLERNWHMLPSASDPNYQMDLFPYQASIPMTPSQSQILQPQLQQSGLNALTSETPVSSVISWIKTSTTVTPQPIPVFQRPPEFYAQADNIKLHRKRGGVEFSNLILLARNSDNENEFDSSHAQVTEVIQTTEPTTNGHKQCTTEQTYSEVVPSNSTQLYQNNRPAADMDFDKVTLDQINLWLNKVYPQRSEHFSEMMNTVDTMYSIALEVNRYESINIEQPMDVSGCVNNNSEYNNQVNTSSGKSQNSPNSSKSTSPQRQRRLYRDVLSGDAENRYAQLEQEALEQYQASDHNIPTVPSEETMAQQYRDLEREALEQYRGDRDDWFTTPLTGEDKGGAGRTEEEPDPPVTITPLVSNGITQHQEITMDHQVGIDEEEATEVGNLEKEDTRDIDQEIQNNNIDAITVIHTINEGSTMIIQKQKLPVWMKHKKKKQGTKSKKSSLKSVKFKKDFISITNDQEKPSNKFSNLLHDLYTTVQMCTKEENKKTRIYNKKKVKQVIHYVNKINNLILISETIDELKMHTEATNVLINGGIIGSCIDMCLEITNQEQSCLQEIIKKTIALKTFTKLFMPFFEINLTRAMFSFNDYRNTYIEIADTNGIDKEYSELEKIINPLKTSTFILKRTLKLCKTCFVNQILSRLAWSCFHSLDPFYLNLAKNKMKLNVFLKNPSFYTMICNIIFECRLNTYYEKYCNNVMTSHEWESVQYLIDENSGKYFINKNLYGLIKDWSWIYYLNLKKITDVLLIDPVIDEAAIIYFDALLQKLENISSLIFQIDWLCNEPCYICTDITIANCFRETNFVCTLSENRWKSEHLPHPKTPTKTSHRSRTSRRFQHNSLWRSSLNIVSSKSNEFIRMFKKPDKQRSTRGTLKRTQSDCTLHKKQDILNNNSTLIKKRLRRNVSVNDSTQFIPNGFHKEKDIPYYLRNYKKQNVSPFRKCCSEQLIEVGCDDKLYSGEDPIKETKLNCQTIPQIPKKNKTQIKPSIKCIDKDSMNQNLNKCSRKHSCTLQ